MDEFDQKSPPKSRAIGLLAKRILDKLPYEPKEDKCWKLTVEKISKTYDVGKGQVYEVFRVFEALLLATKMETEKDSYIWNGFKHMTQILAFLRFIGLQQYVDEEILKARFVVKSDVKESEFSKLHGILSVCQKFLILFLVSNEVKTITLDFACKVIHGSDLTDAYELAKIRRIQNFANVILAISALYPILEKVKSGRKVAYKYCGPELETIPINHQAIHSFPDYRSKYLLFDFGKKMLDKPVRPSNIPEQVIVWVMRMFLFCSVKKTMY